MVVSPCYVPHFFCGTRQGRRTASSFGFPMTCGVGLTPRPLFMPIRGAFPTIHTNLWNPVASCRPCVISPHLRIAPVPGLGPCGIGMLRRLRHGTGHRVLPRKITNPAFRSQLINPACKVGPLKSGLAVLLRMEMARMFARHLRAAGSLPPLSSPRTLYPYIPGPMAGKR